MYYMLEKFLNENWNETFLTDDIYCILESMMQLCKKKRNFNKFHCVLKFF